MAKSQVSAGLSTTRLPHSDAQSGSSVKLAPDAKAQARKQVTDAVKAGGQFLPWYQMSKGIADYRMGNYVAALNELAVAEPKLGSRQGEVTSKLFQAMSLQKTGMMAEARAAFDAASQSLQRGDQVPGVDDLGYDGIENWLICHVTLREAQQTLGISAPAATRPAAPAATSPAAAGKSN